VVSRIHAQTVTPSSAPSRAASSSAATKSDTEGAGTFGFARLVIPVDKNVEDGHIIATGEKGAHLSRTPYDPQVLGVVAKDAAIILNTTNSIDAVPVISNGTIYIMVSSQGGPIKKGDLLTTSTNPGVGMKAQQSGYVLGVSLEDYSNADTKKTQLIAAELNLHYFNAKPTFPGSLTDILKIALLSSKESPAPIFKYLVAAGVVIGSFVLGFMTFGRTAAKGVEALGRNPSASKIIHLGIALNVSVVIVIVIAGLSVAFLILRL